MYKSQREQNEPTQFLFKGFSGTGPNVKGQEELSNLKGGEGLWVHSELQLHSLAASLIQLHFPRQL